MIATKATRLVTKIIRQEEIFIKITSGLVAIFLLAMTILFWFDQYEMSFEALDHKILNKWLISFYLLTLLIFPFTLADNASSKVAPYK
ncbi:hypothetical protein GU926_01925 [Nibribacter ruber]|uniref:Uncharacterized protein n=1 Tax=Nibribacter ruber TaxID=2698458 RepID=A0A6P1NWC7_9BACT|nr:hypothetical protein [Nibribacter ruber]QHL86268.1 hypothetical protein GU926_01925 [Nibribacter ruber]